jgi:hypothetical protein
LQAEPVFLQTKPQLKRFEVIDMRPGQLLSPNVDITIQARPSRGEGRISGPGRGALNPLDVRLDVSWLLLPLGRRYLFSLGKMGSGKRVQSGQVRGQLHADSLDLHCNGG